MRSRRIGFAVGAGRDALADEQEDEMAGFDDIVNTGRESLDNEQGEQSTDRILDGTADWLDNVTGNRFEEQIQAGKEAVDGQIGETIDPTAPDAPQPPQAPESPVEPAAPEAPPAPDAPADAPTSPAPTDGSGMDDPFDGATRT